MELDEYHYGKRWLLMEGAPQLLFTNNETNMERLFGQKSRTPYVKDAFHCHVISGEKAAVNPAMAGTKTAGHYFRSWPQAFVPAIASSQPLFARNDVTMKRIFT